MDLLGYFSFFANRHVIAVSKTQYFQLSH